MEAGAWLTSRLPGAKGKGDGTVPDITGDGSASDESDRGPRGC
jgi:hypothetical protein